jgi:hypothetical protein
MLFQHDGKVTEDMSYTERCKEQGIPCAVIIKPRKNIVGRYVPEEWLNAFKH